MCEMMTIATAIQVAGTAYQAYSADQQVDAQNKFAKAQAKEGGRLANESFINQAGQAHLADSQASEAASTELIENTKRAAEARSTARVSAGEAGVSGVSVDALLNDFYDQEATYSQGVQRQLELGREQTSMDLKGFRSNALDRSNSFRSPALQRPSYLAAGITAGGQVANGYIRYRYPNGKP